MPQSSVAGVLMGRGRSGHRHGQRDGDVKTREKTANDTLRREAWGRPSHCSPRRGLSCPHLHLDSQTPRLRGSGLLWFRPPDCVVPCYAGPSKLRHHGTRSFPGPSGGQCSHADTLMVAQRDHSFGLQNCQRINSCLFELLSWW